MPASEPAPKRLRPERWRLEDRPDNTEEFGTLGWGASRKRFVFIIDCQPVQMITCGHTPLKANELSKMFTKIIDRIDMVLGDDWLPPQAWDDPIIWRPRGRNTVADHLANYTMDSQKSWAECFEWPFPGRRLDECNVMIHSDGGTRRHASSASAWILQVGTLSGTNWEVKTLAMGGTYHEKPMSSFTAETLALAEAALFFASAVRDIIYTPLGKKQRTEWVRPHRCKSVQWLAQTVL